MSKFTSAKPSKSLREFGYSWGGMVEISLSQALVLWEENGPQLYFLRSDGTESAIESQDELEKFKQGEICNECQRIGFELDSLLHFVSRSSGHADWCGKPCAECEASCSLDESMPCSPDCENLNPDGTRKTTLCREAKCDAIEEKEDVL